MDLKAIYQAPTVEEAEMHLDLFEEKWNVSHPVIGKSWRRNWERIIPLFSYPPAIRKAIYTTNAIESVNVTTESYQEQRLVPR